MSSWETILNNFPSKDQLELTEEEQAYIPVYATNAFAADYKETRCLFARFLTPGIWCKGVEIVLRRLQKPEPAGAKPSEAGPLAVKLSQAMGFAPLSRAKPSQ